MFTVEQQITIERPVAEVFAYFADPNNTPRWRPEVLEVRDVSGPLAAGATFSEVVSFMGRKTYTMRVTDFSPERRVTIEATTGPSALPTQTFRFEPVADGTRFSMRADVRTTGLFRALEPLMPRMFRKLWAGYLVNLKGILERPRP
jgi:uncharacterized protein YndB with AHSA1/START domain